MEEDNDILLAPSRKSRTEKSNRSDEEGSWIEEEMEKDAELTVDVYQTNEMIVIKSMIAGVRPEDLDV